jgi:hypothetical protein
MDAKTPPPQVGGADGGLAGGGLGLGGGRAAPWAVRAPVVFFAAMQAERSRPPKSGSARANAAAKRRVERPPVDFFHLAALATSLVGATRDAAARSAVLCLCRFGHSGASEESGGCGVLCQPSALNRPTLTRRLSCTLMFCEALRRAIKRFATDAFLRPPLKMRATDGGILSAVRVLARFMLL